LLHHANCLTEANWKISRHLPQKSSENNPTSSLQKSTHEYSGLFCFNESNQDYNSPEQPNSHLTPSRNRLHCPPEQKARKELEIGFHLFETVFGRVMVYSVLFCFNETNQDDS
jgi:hypothetical protein